MFLKDCESNHLIEVLNTTELTDPYSANFWGRLNIGEDLPEKEIFSKSHVCFPSGEALPQCWTNPHYRDQEIIR